jgi:heme/copper-type cytochrome/quinol oxidase subunit 4
LTADTQKHSSRLGVTVIVVLAVLTAVEFAIALTMRGNPLLTLLTTIAVVKAALILQYFMHFPQLRQHMARVWDAITWELEDQ